MNKPIVVLSLLSFFLVTACQSKENKISNKNWQTALQEKLPLLGHRNWIVITDMAYPLQAKEGITTLYASEPYTEVLGTVKDMLNNSTHVYAHIYQDKELSFLEEDFCSGITDLKAEIKQVLSSTEITYIKHDQLIVRLDSISDLFEVVIIKTGLTKPYTSTFFELDCKYWDNSKQSTLNERIVGIKNNLPY